MRVHRNLHAARSGKPQWVETERGRVKHYHGAVQLVNVTTRIQPAGARKCALSGVRAVCAFFDGDEPSRDQRYLFSGVGYFARWRRVQYDPRKDSAFSTCDGPWNVADAAWLEADGSAWVKGARWEP